jgi:O-succinylhomoserine sulfhydrylase
MTKKRQKDTEAIRIQAKRTHNNEHSVPIYMTSSFVYDNAEQMRAAFNDEIQVNMYTRFTNPNTDEFVAKMCALEGTEAGFATATGMAAVFASFGGLLKMGDDILVCKSIFGATHTLLEKVMIKFGITHTNVELHDTENWHKYIKPNTKMLFVETPTNPTLDLLDLEWVGKFTKKHNLIFNIDNCFATPIIQTPVDYGADIIIHSATKFLDGQGRTMGGIVLGRKDLIKEVYAFCRMTGPAMSPFNSWLLSKSLETLQIRMERHSESALKLATALESHPEVLRVKYPFLLSHPQYDIAKKQMKTGGGVVTFYVDGGLERGKRFLDALEFCSMTANLGDSRTIASHPASTTHSKMAPDDQLSIGIEPGMIRISVGLENVLDIINDVTNALEKSK